MFVDGFEAVPFILSYYVITIVVAARQTRPYHKRGGPATACSLPENQSSYFLTSDLVLGRHRFASVDTARLETSSAGFNPVG